VLGTAFSMVNISPCEEYHSKSDLPKGIQSIVGRPPAEYNPRNQGTA
jgi:hypothetical protein